jgi:hypothetical protein
VNRYRLDVYASSLTDVVESIGGLLVDRSLGGWAVTIFIPAVADVRPLRILGASWASLTPAIEVPSAPTDGTAAAVSATMATEDMNIWHQLCSSYADGRGDFTVWGDSTPDGLPAQMRPVEHRMSSAARAFKSQALRAIGRASLSDTEAIYSSATHQAAKSDIL